MGACSHDVACKALAVNDHIHTHYRAGISQSCTANFQKLNLALLAVLISLAVLVMMCRHEKTQQAPSLEVVGAYDEYCLIRQLVVTRRLLWKTSYLRSDIFTLRSSF